MVPVYEKDPFVVEAGISGETGPWSHGSLRGQEGIRSGGGALP